MKIRIRWRRSQPAPAAAEPEPPLSEASPAEPLPTEFLPQTSAEPDPPVAPRETGIIGKLMIEAYGASNVGCVRTNNEDYFLVAPTFGLYVVADGMGGAQAGEHASKLAVETLYDLVQKIKLEPAQRDCAAVGEELVIAFEEANRRVMDAASNDPSLEGMGTTMIAAIECTDGLMIVSVGDSRAYVYDGKLGLISEDQTWVNEVGRRLGIDEESLKTHPMRHVLTMAIGVSEQLRVHTYELHPEKGTQILLCSDGLHGVAPETEIVEVLQSSEPLQEKCDRLIAAARSHGGPDNVTAVILHTL